jgi:acyl-CoA reductase-like NAD-dependent aldehyde dehydrogenase
LTHDHPLRDYYVSHVMSGGVSMNEALLHVGQHDLPFGGVGASGIMHRSRESHAFDCFKDTAVRSLYFSRSSWPNIRDSRSANFILLPAVSGSP